MEKKLSVAAQVALRFPSSYRQCPVCWPEYRREYRAELRRLRKRRTPRNAALN